MSSLDELGPARPGLLVAVDFDGTLAPIVGDPAASRLVDGALDALITLSRTGATVAVVTGRPAGVAVGLGALDRVPGIVVLGSYGAQRWQDGELTWLVQPAPGLPAATEELRALGHDLELKDLGVVLHTRRSGGAEAWEAVREPVAAIAARHGLHLEPGSLVWELRTPGPDKGDALRELLPGHEAVLYAGDDEGDVPAVQAIRDSGLPAVCVCVERSDGSHRLRRAADLVVSSPAAVVEVLRQLTV